MKIIEENEGELNGEIEKAEKEFEEAKIELDENEVALEDTIRTKNAEFNLAKQQIADAREEISSSLLEADITADEISVKIGELELAVVNMQMLLDSLTAGSSEYEAVYMDILECLGAIEGLRQIETAIDILNEQENQLNEGIAIFNGEIEKAVNEIENAKKELAENEKKLNDAYAEYYENVELFNSEIADAAKEIAEAKAELLDMKRPQWYISNRRAAVGYDALDSGIQVVAIVAVIFPLFFILISMLMTSNSMSRMIAEERGELGTLTSLGYKDRDIIFSYLLYVLSASTLGAVIGFLSVVEFFHPSYMLISRSYYHHLLWNTTS
jgi:putative ABC transport system permease protein